MTSRHGPQRSRTQGQASRSPSGRSTRRTGAQPAGRAVDEPLHRVRVSGPDDIVALVPYLLGFHPEESLVVLLVDGGRVQLTARIDLVPLDATDSVVAQFQALAERVHASQLLLVAYSGRRELAYGLLEQLVDRLGSSQVVEAVYADGTRWWSLLCTGGSGCCPATGTPYDASSHPMAAEAVFAGLSAAPGRGSVESLVCGPPASDVDRLDELARQLAQGLASQGPQERQEEMAGAVRGFLSGPGTLTDADALRLALLAGDLVVRDLAWALMSRRDADDHVDLWAQVVRRCPPTLDSAPLCLLGMAAWIAGNGALQNCCADRVRRLDPTYTMGRLLEDINHQALPPDVWDLLAPELRELAGPLAGEVGGR